MRIDIDRHRVRELVAKHTPLIDVLNQEEYRQSHIPQALNIPLGEVDRTTVAQYAPDQPIIVYCDDFQ